MEAECASCGKFALCGICFGVRLCAGCWREEMSLPSERREGSEALRMLSRDPDVSVTVNCSNQWN